MPSPGRTAARGAARRGTLVLAAVALAAVAVTVALPPIQQDEAYHRFADRRPLLGVPNAGDVLSNVGFLLVGAWGLARVRRARADGALERSEALAFVVLFASAVLTGAGSAWYHLAPDDTRLVWDRLPITAAVAAAIAVVAADRLGPATARPLLPVLVVLGAASVAWWRLTDDLRPYALVQATPLLGIPLMLGLFPGRRPGAGWLLVALAWYGAARACEVLDAPIFALTGVVSGHTLKHVAAAAAVAAIVRWMAAPRPVLSLRP